MRARRDLKHEMEQLKAAHPEVERIPDAVAQAAAQGQSLLEAYEAWKQEREEPDAKLRMEYAALLAENERLKQELRVLRQNANASARTIGGGVQGGGVQAKPEHAFLTGLGSGEW